MKSDAVVEKYRIYRERAKIRESGEVEIERDRI